MNTNKPMSPARTTSVLTIEGFAFERAIVDWIHLELSAELESLDALYNDSFKNVIKAIKALAKKEATECGETTYGMRISFAVKGMKEGLPVVFLEAIYMGDVDAYTARYSLNTDGTQSELYRYLDATISMFYNK